MPCALRLCPLQTRAPCAHVPKPPVPKPVVPKHVAQPEPRKEAFKLTCESLRPLCGLRVAKRWPVCSSCGLAAWLSCESVV